jgi:hypothetical protein
MDTTGKEMSTETVPVQNETEPEVPVAPPSPISADEGNEAPQSPPQEEHVPLSALQKERRKRQETERELQWVKEQQMRQMQEQQQQEDPEDDQLVSRKELTNIKRQAVREVLETTWISSNPEKAADINNKLSEFLKQRPHLARAIEDAPNRYEEAWTLMDALTPKQKQLLRPSPVAKKDAPGNPASVPKAHGINQNIDSFAMDDREFNAWRKSQIKRR